MEDNQFLYICNRILTSNPAASRGDLATLYTTPFWQLQYELFLGHFNPPKYRRRNNIVEEIVSCLLGGYGFKAELGWAAFNRLYERNLIRLGVPYDDIYKALRSPFIISGRLIHYRFPEQKSRYVYSFLNRNDLDSIPTSNDLALREWLLGVKGVGPKTASWITRNYLGSDNVAIIDIHIYRAGVLTGFLRPELSITRDYYEIERRFLDYCKVINVSPSVMDLVMWTNMKQTHKIALKLLNSISYG